MEKLLVHDIVGIGIGPFNLGLAALADPIKELTCIFFDTKSAFSWHENMLLDFVKMQVPFVADLVTSADPTSPYSFLSYLQQKDRLYQFVILEDNYITRKEYNHYCIWVTRQLQTLHFGYTVTDINYSYSDNIYVLQVQVGSETKFYYAKHVVLGIGSSPFVPLQFTMDEKEGIIHSSDYLKQKDTLLHKKSVTIVGSGQSAAEIFYDLMSNKESTLTQLNWATRSSRFHPMETSKLTLEMTSPDYINYFQSLLPEQKLRTLSGQNYLYKGINTDTIAAIYELLYYQEGSKNYSLLPNCELQKIEQCPGYITLFFHHQELLSHFSIETEAVILATGYRTVIPSFLKSIYNRILYDEQQRYRVNLQYAIDITGRAIFVQNAELHTHGFNAADLGMGPYRNAVILNTILGYQYYKVEAHVAFQCFNPIQLFK